jgi:hypothetical protein
MQSIKDFFVSIYIVVGLMFFMVRDKLTGKENDM